MNQFEKAHLVLKKGITGILMGLFSVILLSGCTTPKMVDSVGGTLFTRGGISVRTEPSGAFVYVNEEFVGRAPVTQSFPPGVYRVVLRRRGYEPHEVWVEVPKGKTAEVNVRLERN